MPGQSAPRFQLFGLVVVGGFLGSMLRALIVALAPASPFPWVTAVINLTGSFGVAWTLPTLHSHTRRWRRVAFGAVGAAAAYTTLATFAVDAVTLIRDTRPVAALGYVVLSIGGGILAAYLGRRWGER